MSRNEDIDWSGPAENFRSLLNKALAAAVDPPQQLPPDEWADKFRYLNKDAGAVGGKFRVADVEVARGPMRAAVEPGVKEIVISAATQLMKTTVLECIWGAFVHLDPGNSIIVQPDNDLLHKFSEKKLKPLILATPVLLKAFGGKRAFLKRSSENAIGEKKHIGGSVTITSAGNPARASMLTCDFLGIDEADNVPGSSKEGSMFRLFENRLYKSRRPLMVVVCSPTVEGESEIEKRILRSDRRRAYVACPCCGHEQFLVWEQVKYKDENGKAKPEIAAYHCEACKQPWPETERKRIMMTKWAVKWRQTRHFSCCGERQDPNVNRLWDDTHGWALCKCCGKPAVKNKRAGFDQASKLYSPEQDLSELVREWLDAQGDRGEIMAFVNTALAKTYPRAAGAKVFEMEGVGLQGRVEPTWALLPNKIKAITGGVDVQADRLEAQFVGWGDGDENWALEHHIIPGDPNTDKPWQILDTLIRASRQREDGTKLPVAATCVDSGYLTDAVYTYCNARSGARVWAISGAKNPHAAPFPNTHSVQTDKRRAASFGSRFYQIGTQALKDRIQSMMTAPAEGQLAMHIPDDREAWWFDQMTAEHKVSGRDSSGNTTYLWKIKKDGARNEAFDTYVYAYAALHGLRKMGILRSHHLAPPSAALERMDEAEAKELVAATVPSAAEEQPTLSQAAAAQVQPVRRPKSAPQRSNPFGNSFSKGFSKFRF
ncbi:Phage terminase large subunit (GpA) [Paracoccus haematequi]|uniref:Phage terminase large subunit (GpA) n=1 Tax=Paracoccus haematequi TaxID=2491866 RepID=A0A447IRD4_9RHOB|nr:terminase gpA endonuclease subunit [Paracoccus haematequi]VDS10054.1 Phage terminase large subunit (GpA) [Paracoccus haematequi]